VTFPQKARIAAIMLVASGSSAEAMVRYEFTALSSRTVEFLQGPETVTGSFTLVVPDFIVPTQTFQPEALVSCTATGSVSGPLPCIAQTFSTQPPFETVTFGVYFDFVNYFFNTNTFGETGSFDSVVLTDQRATLVITDLRGSVGPIPEPATWALLIAGFGLVGGALRRRSTGGTHVRP
jgi:hypothetical protein